MFLEEVEKYTVQLAERIKYNQRLAEMEGTSRKDKKEYKDENYVLTGVVTNLKRLTYEEREKRGEI